MSLTTGDRRLNSEADDVLPRTSRRPMPKLALYHVPSCSYCGRVQRTVEEFDVDVELVNIGQRPDARRALVEATGRATVPVLRIEEGGQVRWMPESSCIVDYLYQRAGRRDLLWRYRASRVVGLVAVIGLVVLLVMLTRCGGT